MPGHQQTQPPPGGALGRAHRWFTPRRQMVAIGLAGTVLPLVLVGTAMSALREVNRAHEQVTLISAAQADFQRADMAHDAIRADVYALLLQPEAGGTREEATAALRRDLRDFRRYLDRVHRVDLPGEITTMLADVRPLQEQYADDAVDVARLALADPDAARARLAQVKQVFDDLTEEQEQITEAMSDEADERERTAVQAETQVRRGIVASAAVALLTMLGLTGLLHRLGGSLAALLARERDVAEMLQHSLLPDRLPEVPGVRLAARYVPGAVGTQVGGDWYDVIPLPSGEVGLVMGDVVGHDLDAAASMGQLRNALRACAADGAPPDDVLERLNRLTLQQQLGGMATVLYAVLDPVQGTLQMASAGHYPPLLVTGTEVRFLDTEPCPPVGAVREVRYSSSVHRLPAGSLLVLYTDGLVERREIAVETGMRRLADLVGARAGTSTLEALCDAVLAGMLAGRPPDDDIAILTVAPQAVLGPHLDLVLPAQAEQLAVLRRTLERWLAEAGATDDEVYEITVACSEATTNAIEHAYGPGRADLQLVCDVDDGLVTLVVRDWGQWREPRGQDRGRGLAFMRGLMDEVQVSHGDRGTQVVMSRRLGGAPPETAPGMPVPVTASSGTASSGTASSGTASSGEALPVEGATA